MRKWAEMPRWERRAIVADVACIALLVPALLAGVVTIFVVLATGAIQ